jgi:hypothetical protein
MGEETSRWLAAAWVFCAEVAKRANSGGGFEEAAGLEAVTGGSSLVGVSCLAFLRRKPAIACAYTHYRDAGRRREESDGSLEAGEHAKDDGRSECRPEIAAAMLSTMANQQSGPNNPRLFSAPLYLLPSSMFRSSRPRSFVIDSSVARLHRLDISDVLMWSHDVRSVLRPSSAIAFHFGKSCPSVMKEGRPRRTVTWPRLCSMAAENNMRNPRPIFLRDLRAKENSRGLSLAYSLNRVPLPA